MKPEAQAAVDRLSVRLARAEEAETVLREFVDWVELGSEVIYDPIRDRFAAQVPGRLMRHAHELLNGIPGSTT